MGEIVAPLTDRSLERARGAFFDEYGCRHRWTTCDTCEESVTISAALMHTVRRECAVMHQDDPDGRPRLLFDGDDMENAKIVARQELENFLPTAENINALPEGIRNYVHLLETRCDPAGDVQALILARENVAALTIKVVEVRQEQHKVDSRAMLLAVLSRTTNIARDIRAIEEDIKRIAAAPPPTKDRE